MPIVKILIFLFRLSILLAIPIIGCQLPAFGKIIATGLFVFLYFYFLNTPLQKP
jgi:hypothetical protein